MNPLINQQHVLHNTHWEDPERFAELDPQLRRLKQVVKYKQAQIWAKTITNSKLQNIPVSSLPWQLLLLSKNNKERPAT